MASRAVLSSVALGLHRLGRLATWRRSVRVLYYHSISDTPMRSSVSPSAFERQLEYLRRAGYALISLSQAVDRLATRTSLPDHSVVVTFDDGFEDNYEHALPILARFRVPATVFLTASYIGTDRLPTLTRTDFMPRPLNWQQVAGMRASGVEFGSHTLTHPMLSHLSPEQARREIADSKRLIEDKLGAPVTAFCYPKGDFNPSVKRLVREEGYRAACTTRPGVNGPGIDLFALRRTYVSRRDTPGEFAKKAAGGYDLLQHAQHLWRRLRAP